MTTYSNTMADNHIHPNVTPDAVQERIAELRNKGYTLRDIAHALGISPETARKYTKKFGCAPGAQKELSDQTKELIAKGLTKGQSGYQLARQLNLNGVTTTAFAKDKGYQVASRRCLTPCEREILTGYLLDWENAYKAAETFSLNYTIRSVRENAARILARKLKIPLRRKFPRGHGVNSPSNCG